jgi:hypothetical protein
MSRKVTSGNAHCGIGTLIAGLNYDTTTRIMSSQFGSCCHSPVRLLFNSQKLSSRLTLKVHNIHFSTVRWIRALILTMAITRPPVFRVERSRIGPL